MQKGISIDTSQIDILAKELEGFEEQVGKAAYHALNRTIDQVVTQVGRIVPKIYAIKATEVKDTFKGNIKKPTYSKLEASATSRGPRLTLAHFPHSPQAPISKKYKVRAKIKKASGKRVINTNPKPFVMSTGAKSEDKTQFNIFKREGKAKFPVAPLMTLSIPQMLNNEEVESQINTFALDKLGERLQHEIERAMTNIGGKLR